MVKINNVSGVFQTPTAIHRPQSIADVVELITQAKKINTPIYPVSYGFNWGYGSSSPVKPGCALVDLSGMNRILNAGEISEENPIAVIEPGVTQEKLYQYLQKNCPTLMFNVTGSSKDTSVLGNCLDRGVGYLGPRKEDIFGIEFVDGTGRIIQTGFRRMGKTSQLATSHPYGLGPILDGLLSQSNFGVVTSACFRLIPRRPVEIALSLTLRQNANLSGLLNALVKIKREGLITSVTHVGNQARTHSTLMSGIVCYLQTHCGLKGDLLEKEASRALKLAAPSAWTALAGISGNTGQVRAAVNEIRQRVAPWAKTRVVTERFLDTAYAAAHRLRKIPIARVNAAVLAAIRPLHGLALGVPTDVAIDNLLWKFKAGNLNPVELDQSNCGLIYISPALPTNGVFVEQLLKELDKIGAKHGHMLHTTVNIETGSSMVAVINLLFDRSQPDAVISAHNCSKELLSHIRGAGLEVYRARADMMSDIVARDTEYWKLIRSLKEVFDPNHLISPGRYCMDV